MRKGYTYHNIFCKKEKSLLSITDHTSCVLLFTLIEGFLSGKLTHFCQKFNAPAKNELLSLCGLYRGIGIPLDKHKVYPMSRATWGTLYTFGCSKWPSKCVNPQILSVVPSVSLWNMISVLKGMVLRHIPQILPDISVEQ